MYPLLVMFLSQSVLMRSAPLVWSRPRRRSRPSDRVVPSNTQSTNVCSPRAPNPPNTSVVPSTFSPHFQTDGPHCPLCHVPNSHPPNTPSYLFIYSPCIPRAIHPSCVEPPSSGGRTCSTLSSSTFLFLYSLLTQSNKYYHQKQVEIPLVCKPHDLRDTQLVGFIYVTQNAGSKLSTISNSLL